MTSQLSRRQFMSGTVFAAAAGYGLAPQWLAAAEAKAAQGTRDRFPIITFTKPFQDIGFDQTAELMADIGFAGIECPVRAKGQVLPERVEEDLPKLHEALSKRGIDLTLITTDINKVDPLAERVLKTAVKLGVKRYRLSYHKYDLKKPIPPQIASLKPQLKELASLNKELGIAGAIQNHSGTNYVGAPIWDIYELIRDLDPRHLGTCFDIGHATVEGGSAWPIQARLMEPFLTCVYVKDFSWHKKEKGWKAEFGPLGEGMISREFFNWLNTSSYSGPISLHCEYLQGAGPEQVATIKKDLSVLKNWLAGKNAS